MAIKVHQDFILSMDEDQELSAGMLNRGVSNAQKKVEERNFAMRKHLLEYDDVLNQQREIIYDLRNIYSLFFSSWLAPPIN